MKYIDHTLRLPFTPPIEWQMLLRALSAHLIPGLDNVDQQAQTLDRLLKTPHGYCRVSIDLCAPADYVEVRLILPSISQKKIAGMIRHVEQIITRVFDLESDPAAIITHFTNDDLIAPLTTRYPGLRISGMFDPYELLINTIIGQQISVTAAKTFSTRLVTRFGDKIDFNDRGDLYTYPSPQKLLSINPYEFYKKTNLTHKKIDTIQSVCRLISGGFELSDISHDVSARAKLLQIKGIGPWTVEYVILRGLGDSDGFPADDLVIKRCLGVKNAKEAERMAEKWRPYRGYATMYLWTHAVYA